MPKSWSADDVLSLMRAFQPACVLAAGAELGVFDALAGDPLTAAELAGRLATDLRATTILADALAALGLLMKTEERYGLAPGVQPVLTETGGQSALATVRHLANCLRNWSRFAEVTRSGAPAAKTPSVRGPEGDRQSFIEAMHEISRRAAPALVAALGPLHFRHLLDVGGGPGTWTIALLRAAPEARATLFDLPAVLPLAQRHIAEAGLAQRVTFAAGDLATDAPLPGGADLAWVSAIIHMNSREQNRALFNKVHAALVPGGAVLIRDVIMDCTRTAPAEGALFAVNMLVGTPGGSTYTLDEVTEDLQAAGFQNPYLLHKGTFMDSVVRASKA